MSELRPDIDLTALSRRPERTPPPRRGRRFILPGIIVLGLVAVLYVSARDLLVAAVEVTVVRPRAATRSVATGEVALQAAGWVEPDPFPFHAAALIQGTLAEVLVQESEAVSAGQVVARLVPDDARLRHAEAEAALALARREREQATVERAFAEEDFAAAITLTESVEGAVATVRFREEEHALAALAAKKGEADLEVAREELSIQRFLAAEGAAGPRQVEIADARVTSAESGFDALRAAVERAGAELELARVRARRVARDQELRIDDRRRVAVAKAAEASAEAVVRKAEVELEKAALELERIEVVAPRAGIVLERLREPGDFVSLQGESSSVCSLYDPERLRVRVDVPQTEIAKVEIGQEAIVLSESRRGRPYRGRVLRRVQRADIQKVTLEAQVEVLDEDELLRPDMLCQVRFLTPSRAAGEPAATSALQVPARLLLPGDALWVLDPAGDRARRRSVTVGARDGEWVEIGSGLNLADKLIDHGREQLEDGARVRVRGSP